MLPSASPVSSAPVSSSGTSALAFFDAVRGIVLVIPARVTKFVFATTNVILTFPARITRFIFKNRRGEL